MTRTVFFKGAPYVVTFDDADAWLESARLVLSRDPYGTLRLFTMPDRRSVAKKLTGYKQTGYKNGDSLDLRRDNLTRPDYYRYKAEYTQTGEKYITRIRERFYVRVYAYPRTIHAGGFWTIDEAKKRRDEILQKDIKELDGINRAARVQSIKQTRGTVRCR